MTTLLLAVNNITSVILLGMLLVMLHTMSYAYALKFGKTLKAACFYLALSVLVTMIARNVPEIKHLVPFMTATSKIAVIILVWFLWKNIYRLTKLVYAEDKPPSR